jgi:hypothetical protein
VYAFIALVAATVEAGLVATARKVAGIRTDRTVHKARPQTCADLVDLVATPGRTRPSEVYARAAAGPEGTITAPLSGIECVWYVVRAQERFWAYGPGPYGPKKVERSVKAATHFSGPLAIVDDTGSARVDPKRAAFDLGDPDYSGFEAREGGDGRLYAQVSELVGAPLRARHKRMTIGFLIEEWIVSEGEELHVVGQAHSEPDGSVVLGRQGIRPSVIAKEAPSPAARPDT